MVRVVLDTNVIVSGLLSPSGPSARLLMAVTDARLDIVVCDALLREIEDVLARPKIASRLGSDIAPDLITWLSRFATVMPDPAPITGTTADPKDDFIVGLARESGAAFIVSGDNDLLSVPDPRPPVAKPGAFAVLLDSLP